MLSFDFQLCRRQAAILDQIWTGIRSAWSPCRNFPSLRCCLSDCWRKPRKITPTGGLQNPTKLLRCWSRSAQRESVQVLSRLLDGVNETKRELDRVELNEEQREQESEGRESGKLLSRLAGAIGIRWQTNIYILTTIKGQTLTQRPFGDSLKIHPIWGVGVWCPPGHPLVSVDAGGQGGPNLTLGDVHSFFMFLIRWLPN